MNSSKAFMKIGKRIANEKTYINIKPMEYNRCCRLPVTFAGMPSLCL